MNKIFLLVFTFSVFIGVAQKEKGSLDNEHDKSKTLYLFRDQNDVLIQRNPPILQNHLASYSIYDEYFIERQEKLSKDIFLQKDAGFYSFTILGEKKLVSEATFDKLNVLNRKEFLELYSSEANVFIIEREGNDLFMYRVAPIRYAKK